MTLKGSILFITTYYIENKYMTDTTITKSLRLKQSLLKKAEVQANDHGFQNLSEYLRTLIIRDIRNGQ